MAAQLSHCEGMASVGPTVMRPGIGPGWGGGRMRGMRPHACLCWALICLHSRHDDEGSGPERSLSPQGATDLTPRAQDHLGTLQRVPPSLLHSCTFTFSSLPLPNRNRKHAQPKALEVRAPQPDPLQWSMGPPPLLLYRPRQAAGTCRC